jgi:hypothetical protein
LDVD